MMKKRVIGIVGLIAILSSATFLSSCLNSSDADDPAVRLQREIAEIDAYITTHGLTAIKDPSGVRMVIDELGTGLPARSPSTVIDVNYEGRLFPDGTVFDPGPDLKLSLAGLIDGWKIAFLRLPEGSKGTLFIPSIFGYGNAPQGIIPANSILQFDFEFVEAVISSTEVTQFKSDTTAIETYLEGKGITEYETDTLGLRYIIESAGSTAPPTWYDRVKFKISYKMLTADTQVVFEGQQAPTNEAPSRPVDYIQGIMIALQKLGEGGSATFYIPSGYCFGPHGATSGNITVPANSNLIVDIEVLDINP